MNHRTVVPGLVGHRSPDIRGVARLPCRMIAAGEEPKSRNGKRTLLLDGELVAALTALQTPAAGEHDRKRDLPVRTRRAGLAPRRRVRDHRRGWHSRPARVVFRRVRPPAQAGRAAADHFARLPSHDPDVTSTAAGVPDHIRAAWCGHTVAVNVAASAHIA